MGEGHRLDEFGRSNDIATERLHGEFYLLWRAMCIGEVRESDIFTCCIVKLRGRGEARHCCLNTS